MSSKPLTLLYFRTTKTALALEEAGKREKNIFRNDTGKKRVELNVLYHQEKWQINKPSP